jgi:hypothetical protein
MTIEDVCNDKTIKAKSKVSLISEWLLCQELQIDELLAYAEKQKATVKATCIEAIEAATKKYPAIADESVFTFVTKCLKDNEPRVKWESAKVLANIVVNMSDKAEHCIENLLQNANHEGTVVRWAAAEALVKILGLKTGLNIKLLPEIQALWERETDNAVKKKYLEAIKKIQK